MFRGLLKTKICFWCTVSVCLYVHLARLRLRSCTNFIHIWNLKVCYHWSVYSAYGHPGYENRYHIISLPPSFRCSRKGLEQVRLNFETISQHYFLK
jgi:hypothetical protein